MAEAKCVLWLTAASDSGEATFARRVEAESKARGYGAEVIDAASAYPRPDGEFDNTDGGDGGARLMNDINEFLERNSVVVVNAQTLPPRVVRDEVSRRAGLLIEVRVRNSSGGHEAVDAGGPARGDQAATDMSMSNDAETPEEVVRRVIAGLEAAGGGRVAAPSEDGYNAEEEEEIRRRLEDLGYI